MQNRCPNCGNYWVMPIYRAVHGAWMAVAVIWAVACALVAITALSLAVRAGGTGGVLVAIFAVAALMVGASPLYFIHETNTHRAAIAPLQQCRSCGYRWDNRVHP